MSIDMKRNFLKLLLQFRRHDLIAFSEEHERLYAIAEEKGDYREVTSHYYSVMSAVIDEFFGGNFHFTPPRDQEMTMEEALEDLHRHIGKKLSLGIGKTAVDIGCGVGGVMRDIAPSGASLTGITIAPNEVDMGNEGFRQRGLDSQCRVVLGDAHNMPLEDGSYDAAYAVYALKYIPRLDGVMEEVSRILKPGGKFLIYDLIKTDAYDENNDEHREMIEGLEYACGMPRLHTKQQMIDAAAKNGLTLVEEEDLAETNGCPFHFCFSQSPFFMWLVESPMIDSLISLAQTLRILPEGFSEFNRIFLSGTVEKIVNGGKRGILSGSEIFVFQKAE